MGIASTIGGGRGGAFSFNLAGAVQPTRYVGATAAGAPTTGTFAVGDFVVDQSGLVWVCTVAGTPGTWVQPTAPDPLVADFGLKSQTYDIRLTSNSASVLSTQVIYAVGIHAVAGVTYTGVKLAVVIAGTSTAPTGFFVGVASAGSATGTMQAQSSNLNASNQLTAIGIGAFAFSAPWTPAASGLVEVVILQNGAFAGTNVQFARGAIITVGIWNFGTGLFAAATAGTAQTGLPSNTSALPSAYTTANAFPLWAALY